MDDATGTATIVDDDAAPTLTIANASVTEGNGSTRRITFTLTLSKASGQSASVRYATANGTAVAGSDYSAVSGTLVFAAGTVSRTVVVDILGDNIREPNETFVLNVSLPVNVTLAVTQATGTILNNDQ
jgi:large repetitive protein